MRKRWLCGLLVVVLLLSLMAGLPTRVYAASAMTSSDDLVAYLKKIEGFSKYPYKDYGQWTVGYGTACPADKLEEYKANGITEEAAEALFREQLGSFETAVNKFVDTYSLNLKQHQFDALVTFSYNCGTTWTSESNGFFNQMVRSGNTGTAFIYAICLWCKAGGDCILLDRRLSEANMYINGEYKPYNGSETPYPDNYRWVFLDGAGGTVQYNVHGFDANDPSAVGATFKSKPSGYEFAGWYTAAGTKVEQLDTTIQKDTVLYAKWKDPAGNIVSLGKTGATDLTVTVLREEVTIRSGPGIHSSKAGTAAYGTVYTVSEIFSGNNYTWGKTPQGWIALEFTSYGMLDGWVLTNNRWTYYHNGMQVKNNWVKDSAGWCYLGADGYMVTNGWAGDSKGWCWMDGTGHITKNQWIHDGTGWCYVAEDGYLVTEQWLRDSVGWCYVGVDGYCVTNSWKQDSSGRCWLDSQGRMVYGSWVHDGTGWAYLNEQGYQVYNTWQNCPEGRRYIGADGYALVNCWYEGAYLNENGIPVVNDWIHDDAGWCFLDAQGEKMTAIWKDSPDGLRYLGNDGYALKDTWIEDRYLNADGVLAVNCWVEKDGKRCFAGKDGYIVTDGWIHDGTGWCYVDEESVALMSCWQKDSVGWCYLGADGYMVTNKWLRDSVGWCYVGADGYCLTSCWQKDSVGWCYLDGNGRMVTNRWIRDSVGWCYVGADGYCLTSCWQKDSVGWCYLDDNGRMVYNQWVRDSVGWCYVGDNGYMLANTGKWIDGKHYNFNADGHCTNR